MKRGIVDLSSVIWTCLLAGQDKEFGKEYRVWDDVVLPLRSPERLAYEQENGEGKKLFVNSAAYGYENAINNMTKAMEVLRLSPRDLILVQEGKNSKSGRQAIYAAYKNTKSRTPQQYDEFNKCKEMLITNLLNAGAQMCWQDGGVESDDVIAYLATMLEGDRYVISNDKDLAWLIDEAAGIHHYRMGMLDKNPFGDFDVKMITTYIALVGDSADKIPGCKDFGDNGENSAWKKLLITFGDEGLAAMDGLIRKRKLSTLEEDVAELPLLQKIIDSQEAVYICYELARLWIDKVNTPRSPLQWRAGMVKPAALCEDERLRHYSGTNRIVSAENYEKAVPWMLKQIARSPYTVFDVETSTPPESDDWLEAMDKTEERKPIDVLGAFLTSVQLTFGVNMEHTVYMPIANVNEEGCTNLTIAQVRDFMDQIPRNKVQYIHSVAYELPVCYNAWGEDWKDDPEYHGFLRNVRCTAIASSYVDENRSSGLKSLSKTVLDYDQATYQQTMRRTYTRRYEVVGEGDDAIRNLTYDEYPGFGRIISTTTEVLDDADSVESIVTETMLVEHKMDQVKAREVVDYGCDDTITTAALINHFQVIMEIEKTWSVYNQVETWTAYVQAKGFLDGSEFSLQDMAKQEREDDELYDKSWEVLRAYLIKLGFEGTVTPMMYGKLAIDALEAQARDKWGRETTDPFEWEPPSSVLAYDPHGIHTAFKIVTGEDFPNKRLKKLDKMAKLMEQWADENDGNTSVHLLAKAVNEEDLVTINQLMSDHYDGEPRLDLASPKQVAALLYDHMKLPVNITNEVTALEWKHNQPLGEALQRHRQWRMGRLPGLDERDWSLVRKKAKANDDAIDFAVAFNADLLDDDARAALKAFGLMKKVMTRRSLFYKNYWKAVHWKTGRIHSNIRQCGAVTRRPTSSTPNLYQLPKKGEAVKFRGNFKPHHKKAVVVSIDFDSQELRLGAERSQDKNMLACFVGDNKKGMHNLTASGAMDLKWPADRVEAVRAFFGPKPAEWTKADYDYQAFTAVHELGKAHPLGKVADDLRKDAKNVNFAAQFGGQALKLSETLIMRVGDAQIFLDARSAMFPDVDKAAKRAEEACRNTGYALTMLGARRHLREAILSNDKRAASRAARQAWNMEIQGSAGEMTKLAMSSLWKSGALHRYDVRFFASIYDELVVSVHKDHVLDFLPVMHSCMTQPYSTMQVPILGSISLGPDFADQTECGTEFNPKVVQAALDKIFKKEEATA